MSPTEHDLRSALSAGAGDVPDTEQIISAAHDARARRRVRVLSGAGAIVLVGGIAVGGTLLAGRGSSRHPEADSTPHASATHGAGTQGAGTMIPTTVCPSHAPTLSIGSSSSSGKLFAQPVASVLVCAYSTGSLVAPAGAVPTSGTGEAAEPARVELTGAAATTLTDSLENASPVRPNGVCETLRLADQKTIAVLARSTDGALLPTVVTTINEVSCAVVVSNGTTLRYEWTPPESLHAVVAELTGVEATGFPPPSGSSATGSSSSLAPPSDRVNGSPVH